jgi:cytoskeletal protein RodZ
MNAVTPNPRASSLSSPASPAPERRSEVPRETLGHALKRERERRGTSITELSRVTRIPQASLEAIESDRFDELPGEVFVRGFLKSYAQAVGMVPADVLARYTSSRRVAFVTPLPVQTPLQAAREGQGRRFGVAIAFVLLLILLSLALSIVLKPRVRDIPTELSRLLPVASGHPLQG